MNGTSCNPLPLDPMPWPGQSGAVADLAIRSERAGTSLLDKVTLWYYNPSTDFRVFLWIIPKTHRASHPPGL
jgi:hypothetical protein